MHIAAANLGVSATHVLLNFGADPNQTDDLARKPHDCIPEMHAIGESSSYEAVMSMQSFSLKMSRYPLMMLKR